MRDVQTPASLTASPQTTGPQTTAPLTPAPLTAADFRKAMGHFPTGVCVVALEKSEGDIAAMTINSFVSVSLDPLLVCWNLHNSSSRLDLFCKAERFTISILAAGDSDKARAYASRQDTLAHKEDFAHSAQGLPVIRNALAWFECEGFAQHPAGDHTMILGQVTGLSGAPKEGAKALGFYGGDFISVP